MNLRTGERGPCPPLPVESNPPLKFNPDELGDFGISLFATWPTSARGDRRGRAVGSHMAPSVFHRTLR